MQIKFLFVKLSFFLKSLANYYRRRKNTYFYFIIVLHEEAFNTAFDTQDLNSYQLTNKVKLYSTPKIFKRG